MADCGSHTTISVRTGSDVQDVIIGTRISWSLTSHPIHPPLELGRGADIFAVSHDSKR